MKATLKFNLSDPEQRKAHLRCVKATDMAIVLFDIIHNARRRLQDDASADNMMEEIESVLDKNGVIIDELID